MKKSCFLLPRSDSDGCVKLLKAVVFRCVASSNGLRGRQRIVDYWRDFDEWVFQSNARGFYGETLTFHYSNTQELLSSIGLAFNHWVDIVLVDSEVVA